jgi:4-hydroxybenzoate polyprenyltransferase
MRVRAAAFALGRAADFAFLTRPPLLCVSSTFFFAGAAGGLASPAGAFRIAALAALAPNLLLLVLLVASSFVINQVYDMRSDALNRKNFILTSGRVSRGEAAWFCGALSLAALALALRLGGPARWLGVAGLALGFAYSVPPVRLKGRPVGDMLANGLAFGLIAFALGRTAVAAFEGSLFVSAAPYVLAMCGVFLNTTVPDEAGDRAAGDRTSCVVFGRRSVALAAALMVAAAALLGLLAGEVTCAVAAVASLPAFVAVAAQPDSGASVAASQFAGRALFIAVGIKVPPLLVLGGLVYAVSRIYYARRFGLCYPSMEGASATGRTCPGPEGSCMSKALRNGP